jgi:phage terminase large subunit
MNHSAAVAPALRVQFPRKARCLFKPAPYKVFHGGRGASKSWDMVRAALILGAHRPLFVLCAREIQRSIDESVYKLICDQIVALKLEHVYTPMDQEIRGVNGTRFIFAGLKNQFHKIKSTEGVDLCIVFEATFISFNAWEALLPTIRRDPPYGPFGQGSEVWVEFNPELATDETYKRWVLHPPDGTVVVEINYWDNPWFPEILRKQMEDSRKKDLDNYNTVWAGKTRKALVGAIYAKELQAALTDDPCRISPHVKYDRSKPVTVAFDLGRADTMSLWFMQQFGMDHAAIDYYGNTGFEFSHYLEEIENRKYRIAKLILPHDAKHKVIQARHSVLQQARDAYGNERVPKPIPATTPLTRINAVRSLFPRLFFNEEKTAEGVLALQHYQYGVDDNGQRKPNPLHNWASHPADSLGHYALSLQGDIYERDDDFGASEDFSEHMTHHDQPTAWMR